MTAAEPIRRDAAAADAALRTALLGAAVDFERIADAHAVAACASAADLPDIARIFAAIALLQRGPTTDPATTAPDGAAPDSDRAQATLAVLPAIDIDIADAPPPPPAAAAPLDVTGMAALCTGLCTALHGGADGAADLPALLASAHAGLQAHPPHRLADHRDDPVADFAARVAFNALRHFFRVRHDLAFAPLGSPALFAAVARPAGDGLAPWLGDAARFGGEALVRLVRRAAPAGVDPDVALLATVRVAPFLDRDERRLLAEALGDAGALPVLGALFRSEVRRTTLRLHPPVFWSIRDAAIDLGDMAFAAEVQRHVAVAVADNPIEWVVLAEIAGTAGAIADARAALGHALAIDPACRPALDRCDAIDAGRTADFAVAAGFGSNAERRRARFMQRTARMRRGEG